MKRNTRRVLHPAEQPICYGGCTRPSTAKITVMVLTSGSGWAVILHDADECPLGAVLAVTGSTVHRASTAA